MTRTPKPLAERLALGSHREGDCLLYDQSPNTERPHISIPGHTPKVTILVYRVAYELAYGPIPPKHEIHHLCEQPRCIEPTHLVARTRAEHSAEHIRGAKACPQGHLWTPANTYVRGYASSGRPIRQCRRCRSINQARRDREKRRLKRESVSASTAISGSPRS